jgi:hypothetical protein
MGVSLFHRCRKGDGNTASATHKEKLNKLGQEGWELIGIVSDQMGKIQKLYFKRPIGAGT